MNLKTIVQGFGAAIVVLILRVWPQLSRYHPVLYHSFLPIRSVIWGILIDLGVVSLLAALLFAYLQKTETGLRTLLWALVAAELASGMVTAGAAMRRAPIPHLRPDVVFIVTLLGGLALRWLRPLDYRRAVGGLRVLLLLAGCSMVWMIPELLYLGLRAERADALVPVEHPELASDREDPPRAGRIVWLLFDELSYDQTFDHRFPGLSMPAFDRLKSESVSFSNLKPAGYYTDRVIPGFFLGTVVDNLRSGLDGDPMIQLAGQREWRAFDTRATLFADAQHLGWTTGVVGWYNPYCRILAGTLNYCFWRMGDGQSDGALSDQSVLENAVAPVRATVRGLEHKPGFAREKLAADLAAIMSQAEALIRNQNIGFVFIHLPVPHPHGIYDRKLGRQSFTGTYIDNLALADRTLGELMGTLNSTAGAATTTVIVCSDHSWRVPMWRTTEWTREEETASRGRFDPRPVLMIHYPGQQAEHEVTAPFEEIRIHELIEHMLRGEEPEFAQSLLAGGAEVPAATKP
jgi:Sulfatase